MNENIQMISDAIGIKKTEFVKSLVIENLKKANIPKKNGKK